MHGAPSMDLRIPDFTVAPTTEPDRRRALFRLKKLLPEYVFDTAALEDSPFTYPEVQTLMDGITVGGHKLGDALLVQNQINSWRELVALIEQNRFAFDQRTACALHTKVACEEALEWGVFRSGSVRISGTAYLPPPDAELPRLFAALEARIKTLVQAGRIHQAAIAAFLTMAASQFFYDGNKRTGRLMMNGLLLSHGLDAISVPARLKLDFNQKMVRFYDTGDATEMRDFLIQDCAALALEHRDLKEMP